MIKVIRAERDIHVPLNPENPENSLYRPVQKGLLALVPEGFNLPKDSYIDVSKIDLMPSRPRGRPKKGD